MEWKGCRQHEAEAEKIDSGWNLNRKVFWITNGPVASTLVVYPKTSPENSSKGITAFIIRRGFEAVLCAPETGQVLHEGK